MKKLLPILVILTLLILQLPKPVRSSPASHLVISEIQLTGETGFSTDEFIELYNPTGLPINVAGFKLTKKTATGNEYDLLAPFPDRDIPSGSFFLIAHPTGYRGAVVPDAVFSTTNSVASNNSIILYDASGAVVDTVGLGTSTVFETATTTNPGANKSIERKAISGSDRAAMTEGGSDYFRGNGEDTDDNANDFIVRDVIEPQNSISEPEFVSTAPTVPVLQPSPETSTNSTNTNTVSPINVNTNSNPSPTNSTSTLTNSQTPKSTTTNISQAPQPANSSPAMSPDLADGIILNEVYPAPKASEFTEEFIELMNTTARTVRLDGWKLTDTKKKFMIPAGTSIGAGDVVKFMFGQTKITLNNAGDVVYLQDPTGKVIQGVLYEKASSDKAFAFFASIGWRWTEPTPGGENVLTEEVETSALTGPKNPSNTNTQVEPSKMTIAEARETASGQLVEIEATVIAETGILGNYIMYVQDATAGIKVTSSKDIPDLSAGDVIRFSAKIGTEQGRPKLNLQDAVSVEVLGHADINIPDVLATNLGDYPSRLVRISGSFRSISRSVITIEDSTGEMASAYLKKSAKIDKPDWADGDEVLIVGIVDEFTESLRVLPRSDEDLMKPEVLGEQVAQTANQEVVNPAQEMIEVGEGGQKNIAGYVVGSVVVAGTLAVVGYRYKRRKASSHG